MTPSETLIAIGHSLVVNNRTLISVDIDYFTDDSVWLSRVYTPPAYRNQGYASQAMRKLLNDADRLKVTIVLMVNAYGDMSEEQLVAWYHRLGFDWKTVRDAEMLVREPK